MLLSGEALHIDRVQRIRKMVLRVLAIMLCALFALSASQTASESGMHEGLETLGMALILISIAGRCWSILYLGGAKNKTVIRSGPYSITRNPLYLFAFFGAAGIGLQLGSLVAGAVLAGLVTLVFVPVIRMEERHLENRFGEQFRAYKRDVPRLLPDFRLWKDEARVEFSPRLLMRTFLDACLFLLAIPALELVDYLHNEGLVPVLLHLP